MATYNVVIEIAGPSSQCYGHVDSDEIAQVIADNFFAQAELFGTDGSITGQVAGVNVLGILLHDNTELVIVLEGDQTSSLFTSASITIDSVTSIQLVSQADQVEVLDGNTYLYWTNFDEVVGSTFLDTQTFVFVHVPPPPPPPDPLVDPQVQLRWSDDGAKTWSNWLTRSIGKQGEYNKLVQFWRLGAGRNRVFHVRHTAPTPFRIMGARIEVTPGNN